MNRVRDRLIGGLALLVIMLVSVVLGGLAAGYRPVIIQTGSMVPTAPPKALIIASPRDASDIAVGDIVVMRRPGATPVTHRVIEIEGTDTNRFAITQGDANESPDAAPYPLEGEDLVARWIRPGWGGIIQSLFQPGVALAVMAVAVLALAAQALRFIWKSPSPIAVDTANSAKQIADTLAAEAANGRPPTKRKDGQRRSRKPLVLAIFPLTAVFTTGVAWALFVSTDTVASNDFATAACFDAQLGSVQSGEAVHAVNGNVSVPITAVDPTGSFVVASVRSASNEPADSVVTAQLSAGGTSVELDRLTDSGAPPAVTVAWSVVEYTCGVTVQRGVVNGNGSSQLDIPISSVDLSTTFALSSTSPAASATQYDADDSLLLELASATTLRIRTAGAAIAATRSVAWQVISFDDPGDASTRTLTGSLGAGAMSTNLTIPTPVDPTSTFIVASATTASTGPDVSQRQLRARLIDSTTVEVSRLGTGTAMEISVQVVTLRDGTSVRHGFVDFASGQPVRTVDIEAVDPQRATALSTVSTPGIASGGQTDHAIDDIAGEASATFTLTDGETLSVQRASTASNASFGWQVIEWAGPGWWNPNYDFRQRIDVDTGTAAAPDEYTLPFTIDHSALVTAGLSRADGSDVRVMRWDGSTWTELDRILDDGNSWNQVATTLRFRTTDAIEAASTSTYWLYFGNTSPALAFADPENVWLLTEDFESGTLGDFEDRTGGTSWYVALPWTRRIPITVPAGRTTAPLADFTLLVSLTDADLGTNAQSDGSDIRFTASDGSTPLAHEIENYDAGTGALDVWVRIPTLDSATSTTIYLYYGASDAPAQIDVRGTWSNEFEAAWHLSRDPAGTAPQLDDSTVRNHDGSSRGAMIGGDLVPGLIDDAVDFDGANDMLETDPFDLSMGALTMSGWVNLDSYGTDPRIVTKAYDDANSIFELAVTNTGNVRSRLFLDGSENLVIGTGGGVTLGSWHHVAMTWDGATIKLYVDGTEVASQAASGSIDTDSGMPVTIGGITSLDRQLDGSIDEVRLVRIARSAAWIGASESNQRNPGAFHTRGAVETGTWLGQGTWAARKPVVVDADLVSADATDFTLLVEVTDPELQASATTSGNDVVFTASDGTTRLDHVIESWNSATGTLSAWVKVPLLSSTTDTELFVYYGNPAADDQQDPVAVFGPNADLTFLGVS